jgi:hypothetical protein
LQKHEHDKNGKFSRQPVFFQDHKIITLKTLKYKTITKTVKLSTITTLQGGESIYKYTLGIDANKPMYKQPYR